MKTRTHGWIAAAAMGAAALLAGCDDPSPESVQRGYRGVGMVQHYMMDSLAEKEGPAEVPAPLPAASGGGPKAGDIYQNVRVLDDLSVGEFGRLMQAMTDWVAPEEGCTYCHSQENFASETKYTKLVSRRMLQMTRHINSTWESHVGQTGVTCYTCHRGNNVPEQIWFKAPPQTQPGGMAGNKAGQNAPSQQVALSSLPNDPFTPFLLEDYGIRVASGTALPTGNRTSIKQTEWTYGLMMHMSDGLGVNCTYCHNSRAFRNWEQSTPQRVTAWHGIRMSRDINNAYLEPLGPQFPAHRLGPTGDVGKANCGTCHLGVYKPLFGAQMLKDYPNLKGPASASAASERMLEGSSLAEATE